MTARPPKKFTKEDMDTWAKWVKEKYGRESHRTIKIAGQPYTGSSMWNVPLEEQVEEAGKNYVGSDHKNPAKGEDGCWSCSECGAESFDKEQFEEAAVYMKCPGRDLTDVVESEKVAKQIEGARSSMKKMGVAAEKATTGLDEFSRKIMEAMTKPIENPDEASSTMPFVMHVDPDKMDEIKHISFDPADTRGLLLLPESMSIEYDGD